jgi:uncharacterized protein YjaG (DUF416 family)
MSDRNRAPFVSLSRMKKLVFLIFLYERMIPELRDFCFSEGRDFSIFQKAREEFWQAVRGSDSTGHWKALREDILDATPDTEDYGTLAGSFALNAALVAAETAGFIDDGQDAHILDAIRYAEESLSARIITGLGLRAYNRRIIELVEIHPLVEKERRVEEEDCAFLSTMSEPPWSDNLLSALQHRAETQNTLLSQRTPSSN